MKSDDTFIFIHLYADFNGCHHLSSCKDLYVMTRKPNNHAGFRRCHQCHQRFFIYIRFFLRERADDGRADFELTPCKLTFAGGLRAAGLPV